MIRWLVSADAGVIFVDWGQAAGDCNGDHIADAADAGVLLMDGRPIPCAANLPPESRNTQQEVQSTCLS